MPAGKMQCAADTAPKGPVCACGTGMCRISCFGLGGLFAKTGIPGDVKRYIDVICVAPLCRNPDEEAAAAASVSELTRPAVYPTPLCLNMGPRGNKEFLEANVTVTGNRLALSLSGKVAANILCRLPPYRQKLSLEMSRDANRIVLSGILTRILQSTIDSKLTTM